MRKVVYGNPFASAIVGTAAIASLIVAGIGGIYVWSLVEEDESGVVPEVAGSGESGSARAAAVGAAAAPVIRGREGFIGGGKPSERPQQRPLITHEDGAEPGPADF